MFERLRAAGLVWTSAAVVLLFAALVALGNWQWSRLEWKQGLLRQLEAAEKAPPVRLAELLQQNAAAGRPLAALRFRKVVFDGRYDDAHPFYVWDPAPSGPAWSVINPVEYMWPPTTSDRPKPPAFDYVLVIRGTIPADKRADQRRRDGLLDRNVHIIGRIRLDRPNTSAPDPNFASNEWFTRDLQKMTGFLDRSRSVKRRFAPFFVEMIEGEAAPSYIKPTVRSPTLPNRHLEYALTWWALAATLLAFYAVFVWGRLSTGKP